MLAKKENTVRHGLVLRKMKAPSHTHVQKTWKSLCWGAESFSSCLHVSIGPFLSNLNLMWNIGESSMWGCGVTFVNMFISSVIDLAPFCGMSRQRWDLHGASAASPSPIAVELHFFDVCHFDCCKCGAWRSFFYDRPKTNDTPTYQRSLCVKHSTPNNQNFIRFQLKVHHGALRRPICQIF